MTEVAASSLAWPPSSDKPRLQSLRDAILGAPAVALPAEPRLDAVPHPAHFYIDVGNAWNLRCPFCITGMGAAEQAPTLMTLQQYSVILDKVKHSAKLIALYNWGEPLLNPALVDIVRLTSQAGVRSHIDTNLSLKTFTAQTAEGLVDAGLSSLFVSLDGVTQAAYETYRVRGRIDLVLRNLDLLLAAKAKAGSKTPFIGWQYHVHAYNEADMPEARRIAQRLSVPITFKRLSTPLADWKSSYHDSDEMFIEHDPAMAAAYNPPAASDWVAQPFHPMVMHPCRQMFHGTMTVNANGDVYPCTTVEGPKFALGNLLTQTLDEVWNGPGFTTARRFIRGFGPAQGTGSPCELYSCPMPCKTSSM